VQPGEARACVVVAALQLANRVSAAFGWFAAEPLDDQSMALLALEPHVADCGNRHQERGGGAPDMFRNHFLSNMKRISKLLVTLVAGVVLGSCAFMQHPTFGKLPEGTRLQAIKASPNYADGQFRYPLATPINTDNTNIVVAMIRCRCPP
jgi:hypothetical protein